MIQKTFKIGNSTAVTIPKEANIKPGTKVKFKNRTKNRIVYEIVEEKTKSLKEHIEETSGGYNIDINSKELEETIKFLMKNPYEKI